jgi:hypothetical protein
MFAVSTLDTFERDQSISSMTCSGVSGEDEEFAPQREPHRPISVGSAGPKNQTISPDAQKSLAEADGTDPSDTDHFI